MIQKPPSTLAVLIPSILVIKAHNSHIPTTWAVFITDIAELYCELALILEMVYVVPNAAVTNHHTVD